MRLLVNGWNKAKKWVSKQKLSRKIAGIYLVCFLCSLGLTRLLYQVVSTEHIETNADYSSYQTMVSVGNNIESMIKNVDKNYSLMLKSGYASLPNSPLTTQQKKQYDNYFFTMVDTDSNLSGVYIIDKENKVYGMDKYGIKKLAVAHVQDAPWYAQVTDRKGGPAVVYDAGGIFNKGYSPFVSVIHLVNDLSTQKPTGFVLLNVNTAVLEEILLRVFSEQGEAAIYDDHHIIASTPLYEENDMKQVIQQKVNAEEMYYSEMKAGNMHATLYLPVLGWRITAQFPVQQGNIDVSLNKMTVLIFAVNAALMLLCTMLLSRSITQPIHKLTKAMRHSETGDFQPVEQNDAGDEIAALQRNYNHMVHKLQSLFAELVKQQEMKREAELRVLQEQIKPHFLYNTLETIGYMALTNEGPEVYDALEVMGDFYRKSLSKGSDEISLEQELDIVRNYTRLLKLRYEDMFTVEYAVEKGIQSVTIPKLILQPLVENAVYHGIKPLGEQGKIWINAYCKEKALVLQVVDNGVGFGNKGTPDLSMAAIEKLTAESDKGGFGVVGTAQRVYLYSAGQGDFTMRRENDRTIVEITLPL